MALRFLLLLTVKFLAGNEVRIVARGNGFSDFYIGESLEVNCAWSTHSHLISSFTLFFVDNSSQRQTLCRYDPDAKPKWRSNTTFLASDGFSIVTAHACKQRPRVLTVSTVISDIHLNREFTCLLLAEGSPPLQIASAPLPISLLKVAPRNLTMSVTSQGKPVVALTLNQSLTLACQSIDAIPPSKYRYEVLRHNEVVSVGEKYRVTAIDLEEGVLVQCTDVSHINWCAQDSVGSRWLQTIEFPQLIEMYIKGPVDSMIVEGVPFTFTCVSYSAFPKSTYKYEVIRGSISVVSSGRYTSTPADRGGITLKCTDITHGGLAEKYTSLTREITPNFVSGGATVDLNLNVFDENKLNCLVESRGKTDISWICSGCLYSNNSTAIIPAHSRQTWFFESISCTVTLQTPAEYIVDAPSVSWTWKISWSSSQTKYLYVYGVVTSVVWVVATMLTIIYAVIFTNMKNKVKKLHTNAGTSSKAVSFGTLSTPKVSTVTYRPNSSRKMATQPTPFGDVKQSSLVKH